jgi:hypothetical protein
MQYIMAPQESICGSISLTDGNVIALGGPMPDSIRSRFRESYQNAADGINSDSVADFDEVLLELVGSVVNAKMTILHAVALLLSINFSESPEVMRALADSLWFWGTQVSLEQNFHATFFQSCTTNLQYLILYISWILI